GPDTASISQSTVGKTVNENQPISTISCSASCYPTCTYSWRKTTLVPSSASDNHNVALDRPDTATLGVPSKYTAMEGHTLMNVTCSSVCLPGCSYNWRNVTNNAIVSRNRSLTVGPIDRYMTDTYRCDVDNIYSAYNKTARSELE
ncbi:hypothetical protein MAR_021078, partial [Mya arenaria]